MAELVAAIGLALAIEGLFCAAAPDVARRAMAEAAQAPRERPGSRGSSRPCSASLSCGARGKLDCEVGARLTGL